MGRTPFYRISNDLEQHFSNFEQTRTCSDIDDRTRSPHFWLRTIKRSNFKPNRAFTRFTKLLFDLTRTSLFQTWNKLECVHLLVIEPKHPIFGLEWSNIELQTLFDPSLAIRGWREIHKVTVVLEKKQSVVWISLNKRFWTYE